MYDASASSNDKTAKSPRNPPMKNRAMLVAAALLLLSGPSLPAHAQLGFSLGGLAQKTIGDAWRKVVQNAEHKIASEFNVSADLARAKAAGPEKLDELRDRVKDIFRDLRKTAGGIGSLEASALVGIGASGGLGAATTLPLQQQLKTFFEGAVDKVRDRVF